MRKRLIVGSGLFILVALAGLAALGLLTRSDGTSESTSDLGTIPVADQNHAGPSGTEKSVADGSSNSSRGASGGGTSGSFASPQSAASPATSGSTASDLPSLLDRKVILNATLGLNVGDVAASFAEASRLARASGGYVEKSSYLATDPNDASAKPRSASLTIRVPADQYDPLLAQFRSIAGAKVNSEGSKSTEITEQYADLQSRLRNLERTEQSYLKLLDQAKSIQDILTVNDRLDGVRAQIEQIQGRLQVMDKATDLATIDLSLIPIIPGQTKPADTTGPKPVSQAFADAWEWSLDMLRYAAAGGAVAVVALAWLAVPALILVIAVRRMLHRKPRTVVATPPPPPAPAAS